MLANSSDNNTDEDRNSDTYTDLIKKTNKLYIEISELKDAIKDEDIITNHVNMTKPDILENRKGFYTTFSTGRDKDYKKEVITKEQIIQNNTGIIKYGDQD